MKNTLIAIAVLMISMSAFGQDNETTSRGRLVFEQGVYQGSIRAHESELSAAGVSYTKITLATTMQNSSIQPMLLTATNNPGDGWFEITSTAPVEGRAYSVMNALGQILVQGQAGSASFHLDLKNFGAGIYYFMWDMPNNSETPLKLIIQ